MPWSAEALRFPVKPLKNPYQAPYPSFTKHYSWHNAVRQVTMFSWHLNGRDFHCLRVQWWHVLHNYIQLLALYLMWGLHADAQPWKPIPWSSCHTVFGISRTSTTFTHYAPQHSVTLFCDFTWSSKYLYFSNFSPQKKSFVFCILHSTFSAADTFRQMYVTSFTALTFHVTLTT